MTTTDFPEPMSVIAEVPSRDMAALREWLAHPNGAHAVGRVTFESVEGGGIFVRVRPWTPGAEQVRAEPATTEQLAADIDERDSTISSLRADLDFQTKAAFANQAEANRLAATVEEKEALLAQAYDHNAELQERRNRLAATIAAIPDAHHAANLAHTRVQRDRFAATVKAAYAFADEMAGYCSPYGVSSMYAKRLREALDKAGGGADRRSLDEIYATGTPESDALVAETRALMDAAEATQLDALTDKYAALKRLHDMWEKTAETRLGNLTKARDEIQRLTHELELARSAERIRTEQRDRQATTIAGLFDAVQAIAADLRTARHPDPAFDAIADRLDNALTGGPAANRLALALSGVPAGKGEAPLVLSPLTIDAVQAEALRAYLKHGPKSLTNPDMPVLEKLAALVEECGEVGRALTYDQDHAEPLVKELIQVASVALSWVESIEGGKA